MSDRDATDAVIIGSCTHQRLAFMNTTGGATCVHCMAYFAADSPEGKRAEAEWRAYLSRPTDATDALTAAGELPRQLTCKTCHEPWPCRSAGSKSNSGIHYPRTHDPAAGAQPASWFNQVCKALGLFDGARPVPVESVLWGEVLPTIEALKANNPEAGVLVREQERVYGLWRDALARLARRASPDVVPRAVPDVQGLISRLRADAHALSQIPDDAVFTKPGQLKKWGDLIVPVLEQAADALIRAVPDPPVGWQPIESAPKDGTRVLVFCLGEVRIVRWGKLTWITVPGDYGLRPDYPPTHWMPLPDPPSSTTEDEDLARRDDPTASGPTGSSRSQPKGSQR